MITNYYTRYQKDVVYKRTAYDLNVAKERLQDKANFMDEYIVFVLDGYGNYYYTYDQVQIVTQGVDEYEYWAYNKEQAIYLGYKAWK